MNHFIGRLAAQFDTHMIIALSMVWVGAGLMLSPMQGIGRPMNELFHINGSGLGVSFLLCATSIARRPTRIAMLVLCLPLYIYIGFGFAYLFLYGTEVSISYLGIYVGYALLVQRLTVRSVRSNNDST